MYIHTHTNKHKNCKAILVPASHVHRMRPAGKQGVERKKNYKYIPEMIQQIYGLRPLQIPGALALATMRSCARTIYNESLFSFCSNNIKYTHIKLALMYESECVLCACTCTQV